MTKEFKYLITKEEDDYVIKCLNVEVSTFGKTELEAKENLKEALEAFYEVKEIAKEINKSEKII